MVQAEGGFAGGGSFDVGDAFGVIGSLLGGPGGWISLAGGVLGGIFGSQESPQQKATEEVIGKLKENEDYFKSTPFTKDEIMNVLLPQVQKLHRGAADVAAGKIGSTIGEAGVAKGQSFVDYYTQAIAPIIAEGESRAASEVSRFGMWFSDLDTQAKDRFMNAIRLELSAAQGLPVMSPGQQAVTSGLAGAGLASDIYGDVVTASATRQRTGEIEAEYGNI